MTLTSPPRQRRCRAKDPAHCAVHGKPVTADSLYQAFLQDQQQKPRKKVAQVKTNTPASRVNRAVTRPLGWTGTKPVWWDTYQNEAAAHPMIPSTTELIDVIDSPVGKLAVVWQEDSQDDVDTSVTMESGVSVHAMYYKKVDTGETVGYLKQQYMTAATFKRSFGDDEFTPFRFKQRRGGHDFNLTYRDEDGRRTRGASFENLTGDDLIQKRREVWAGVMRSRLGMPVYVNGEHIPSYNVNATHAPADTQVRKDLKKVTKNIQAEIDDTLAYYAVPFVDYSEVDDDTLQGKGFGAALYVYTARKLAEHGQVLRGSGLQSDEAQAVWQKFEQHLPQHVKPINQQLRGKTYISNTLDFRTN